MALDESLPPSTPDEIPRTRICSICKQEKVLATEFRRQVNGKYGHQSACKPCANAVVTAYRQTPKGKEKYKEYARRHREKPGYNQKHRSYRDTPRAQYLSYRKGAEKRNLPFEFTLEQFTELFWQKPCSYCGDPIPTIGIDRVDNTKGYTLENAAPCCYTCNLMKLKTNRADFIAKCKKIASHNP